MKKTMLFIGSVIILILSAVTFIFIPAMADGMGNKELVFGKYGNKKIEYKPGTEFAAAVNNYTEMYRKQGYELRESDYYYIYNDAFISAVNAIANAEEVKKSGYAPSSDKVNRDIVTMPMFADENGKFSMEVYESYEESYRNDLKKDIVNGHIWNRYSEDLLGSQSDVGGNRLFGLKTSDAELTFLADMGADKRAFDMAVFNKADYPDSAVRTFGESNKDNFVKYNLSIISVKESSKAKSILKQIKNEEITFSDAVAEYSDKAYSGSDGILYSNLGYQIKNILKNQDDAEKVFSLNPDELSAVIETTSGYSVFRCNLPKVEPDFKNKTTLEAVRNYIEENEASKIEDYFVTSANGLKANAATKGFAAAAKDSEAKYVKVPAFPLNYDNSSIFDAVGTGIEELSSAASNENFLEKAFALKKDEISEPVVLGDYIIVLKNTGIQKDAVTTEAKDKIADSLDSLNSSVAQRTLMTSKKVVNNVSEVFFNQIMK